MYIDFKGYLKQNNEYVEFIDGVQSDDSDVDDVFINTLVEDSIYELFNNELYTKSGDDIDDTYGEYDISKMNESELIELFEADPRDTAHPSDASTSMVNNLDLQVQLSKINYIFCFIKKNFHLIYIFCNSFTNKHWNIIISTSFKSI